MFGWTKPVSFVNARVVLADGTASSVRFAATVLGIDAPPREGDTVVDLDGAFVMPGLINSHDHLELNHYGTLKRRAAYANASDWIEDLRPVLQEDALIRLNMAFPLAARLFIGGLKNVLSGVTTVAHHNPRYRQIGRAFPVRVLEKYRWAHSFWLEGKPVGAGGELGADVREEAAATPEGQPFMVHLGEGVDDRAASELARLEAGGGLRDTTVLVHGVAITSAEWARVVAKGASLVWCPASNEFLLGRTAPVRAFLDATPGSPAHIALGSDSRLTGSHDLLEEMKVARAQADVAAEELLQMVTTSAARVLKLPSAGRIAVGAPADLIVLPALRNTAADTLLAASRREIALVAVGGRPVVGAPSLRPVFAARRTGVRPIVVDGAERLAASRLAAAIARSPIHEPGVECR